VFNVPFGSWFFVIAMMAISVYLLHRDRPSEGRWHKILTLPLFLLSMALACSLLSMEVSQFWRVNHPIFHYRTYEASSLVILWSLISTAVGYVLFRKKSGKWMPLSWVCFGIGLIILLAAWSFDRYYQSPWLILNVAFLPKLLFVISLWYGAGLCRQLNLKWGADVQSLTGHGLLALLVALEFARWGGYSHLVTPKMSISFISAAWAIHAFIVIWIGLRRRKHLLRYLGFILFLFTVGKTLTIDMSGVEKVYRIISFAASGLLLVAAGYFYQRYTSKIFGRPDSETRK
jgi:uncharacterized membrane protein